MKAEFEEEIAKFDAQRKQVIEDMFTDDKKNADNLNPNDEDGNPKKNKPKQGKDGKIIVQKKMADSPDKNYNDNNLLGMQDMEYQNHFAKNNGESSNGELPRSELSQNLLDIKKSLSKEDSLRISEIKIKQSARVEDIEIDKLEDSQIKLGVQIEQEVCFHKFLYNILGRRTE